MHMAVTPAWRKSSYCANQTCVEVADRAHDGIAVRDAKELDGSVLSFERETWAAFVGGIKAGRFDRQ
ncbi:DUF397 domain-containing protein [Dactylosporangium salmoneum]|uniref:DUF397 domain-containing protein n=1 Tax=Dactylosporangium salmoneum TaxID=53361 RepID=A0ABN3GH57_9ACTN